MPRHAAEGQKLRVHRRGAHRRARPAGRAQLVVQRAGEERHIRLRGAVHGHVRVGRERRDGRRVQHPRPARHIGQHRAREPRERAHVQIDRAQLLVLIGIRERAQKAAARVVDEKPHLRLFRLQPPDQRTIALFIQQIAGHGNHPHRVRFRRQRLQPLRPARDEPDFLNFREHLVNLPRERAPESGRRAGQYGDFHKPQASAFPSVIRTLYRIFCISARRNAGFRLTSRISFLGFLQNQPFIIP